MPGEGQEEVRSPLRLLKTTSLRSPPSFRPLHQLRSPQPMGGEGRKWAGAWAHLPPLAGRPLRVGTGLGHSPPLHLTALILGDRGMHR